MFLCKRSVDSTKGPLLKLIAVYTVPLIISTLIQSLFNAVDIAVLSAMADTTGAVASVGATTSIIHLIVNTFVGLSGGTKLIMARQIGMKDVDSLKKTINTSLISSVFIGIPVAVLGFIFAPKFLELTNCPPECFEGALVYLRMYLCGAPVILLYNYGSAVLSTSGDTQRPLYYILAGGVLNVMLNVVLCFILPQKVLAVAIATISSQALGAVLVLSRLCRMDGDCKVDLRKMKGSRSAFGKILRYGLPIAMSQMLYPLANLQIQSAINSFGVAATAGNSAAATIESIPSAFTVSFGTTATVFIGQNLGADKRDRVKKSFILCLALGVFSGLVIGGAMYLSGEFWLGILTKNDPEAIRYGITRMFYITLFYFIAGANNCLANTIQTYGYTTYSTATSIFCVLVFRVIWMRFVYPHFNTFDNLMLCFLVSWILTLIFNVCALTYIMTRYNRGKYRKI